MNIQEAIEKGYRLTLTGVNGQLVDLEESTIEDLRRAIIVISSDRDRWKEISKELYTWLQPSPEDDSVYEAGVEAMTMYCEAMNND